MSELRTERSSKGRGLADEGRPSGFVCPFCRVKVRYEYLLFNDNADVKKPSSTPDTAYGTTRQEKAQPWQTGISPLRKDADISETDEAGVYVSSTTSESLLGRTDTLSPQTGREPDKIRHTDTALVSKEEKDNAFAAPAEASGPLQNWTLGRRAYNDVRARRFENKKYFCSEYILHQERTVFSWKPSGKPDPEQGVAVVKDWLIEGLLPSHVYTGDIESNNITVYADMLCPYCGCEIPAGYCEADADHIKNVALGGGSGAGKTQYLYAAYRETSSVRGQVLASGGDDPPESADGVPTVDNLGRYADISWARESKWFLDIWGSDFTENEGLKMATEAKPVFPAMMTVSPLKDKKNKYFIIIYDIAGETFQGTEMASRVFAMDYFASVSDILFMIDPAQIFTGLRGKNTRQCKSNISEALAKFSSYPFIKKLDNIAVTLTKSDLLMQYKSNSGEPYISKRMCAYEPSLMKNHADGFDMEFCIKNSRQIECMLDQGQDERRNARHRIISRDLRNIILTSLQPKEGQKESAMIRFFAVSTKARIEQADNIQFTYRVNNLSTRIRLLEPLMFLMYRWGIIPLREESK